MDSDLVAFNNEWATGDRDVARTMASAYVDAHPELADRFGEFSIPALVAMVDSYRESGNEEQRTLIDIWLLHAFYPQVIVGAIDLSGEAQHVGIETTPVEGLRRDI